MNACGLQLLLSFHHVPRNQVIRLDSKGITLRAIFHIVILYKIHTVAPNIRKTAFLIKWENLCSIQKFLMLTTD